MEELEKLYDNLSERYEYLLNEEENRRSPYMLARLDECRLHMVYVQQLLLEHRTKPDV
jgi:hypothetical protein